MSASKGLIDSHAHLSIEGIHGRLPAVLDRCLAAGVTEIITVGTDVADAQCAVEMARDAPFRLHVAAGIHPHEAGRVGDGDLEAMRGLWGDSTVVACGEMGLDYHYDFSEPDVQRSIFACQLQLARECDKPVIIHCREAFSDCRSLLVDHGFTDRRVVFHCFTGSAEEAAAIAEAGWRLSFTGIVTFKKSGWLQEIAENYPSDKLMIETDSPYLSPEPVRGHHPNEPANLAHIARFLAELRGEDYDLFVEQTARNTREYFRL